METAAGQWVCQARYDLDTARAMQDAGRYLYVLFCCQQAVEKALKAVIVQKTGEHPPRIHKLRRLAEIAGLQTAPEQDKLLAVLSSFYVESRYPEEAEELVATATPERSRSVLRDSEALIAWLVLMIK
ncbi:HEPN domain-containing protein [Candidatus Poribacteria bacterium]|nr:HEPN domain-containing protein [Candidatus Poribacteria bacterium]